MDQTHTSGERRHVSGPLRTLKVLELGHFVAAPFCSRLLADQGATVVKVEPPGGDPARDWGLKVNGQSVMWSSHNRNKRCITLDLKSREARPAVERLIAWADVIIENFRPGQLERWGLATSVIHAINPRCVIARISGYGQDGPYRDRSAFGAVAEAFGGLRYLTGYPPGVTELPPVRTGVSLGDDVAALYAILGIFAAIYERDVIGTGVGRVVDVALYEGVFSLLEGALPEYASCGVVRHPSGSSMPTAVPSDTYRTRDGQWLVLAGNSDQIFARLCEVMGRPDVAADPRFRTNSQRLNERSEIDRLVADWMATQDAVDAESKLNAAGVPSTRALTIEDCVSHEHYRAREMIIEIDDPEIGKTLHPGIVPRLDSNGETGRIAWPGPAVGAHNEEVFRDLLGMDVETIAAWKKEGAL